jgi:HAD superfamily hydrolase (TIGR01509 family)
VIRTVVFDMDGVIIDSEPVWQTARAAVADAIEREWSDADSDRCRGLSSSAWSEQMAARFGHTLSAETIYDLVIERMVAIYDRDLPVFPGAVEAIERIADRYDVAIASGSPRALIDLALDRTGLRRRCVAVGYGDEVERGKPAPDIYLDVMRTIGAAPSHSVGIEDSINGLRSVQAAGMHSVAVTTPGYQLPDDILAKTAAQVDHLADLHVSVIEAIGPGARQ